MSDTSSNEPPLPEPQLPEPQLLVWPPPEEDLADWHVIPLLRPDPKPVPPTPAPAPPTPVDAGTADATNKPKRPVPAWLVNHTRARTNAESVPPPASQPLPPRAVDHKPGDALSSKDAPKQAPPRLTLAEVPPVPASLTQVPVDAPLVSQRRTDRNPATPRQPHAPAPAASTIASSHAPTTEASASRHAHASTSSLAASPLALDRLEHARAATQAAVRVSDRGITASVPAPRAARSGAAQRAAVVVLALLAVGQAAYIGARLLLTPAQAAPASVLIVHSEPTGADVFIDGERRGETPFRGDLPPGEHVLELRKNGRVRSIPLILAAGMQSSQYVEMSGATPRPARGDPSGSSSSPGAQGTSPDASPADHARPERGLAGGAGGAAASGATTGSSAPAVPNSGAATAPAATPPAPSSGATRDGAASAGAGASGTNPGPSGASTPADTPADATEPAAPPTPPVTPGRSGLVVESPLNLTVLRNGEVLGNSDEGRLALGAGHHELELRNDSVGYRAVMSVEIPRGRVVTLPVELPQSTLDISATPSARVWIDGRTIGNAPITQLALPVGSHEVRFEHPDYGERRVTVLVRVGATAQASVDFTKP